MTGESDGLDWAVGPVIAPRAERSSSSTGRQRGPFVRPVSPPIDAGFYAYDVPPEHEQAGRSRRS